MAIEWGQLSPKAILSIRDSTRRINIWHGAVRSSKTINSIIRFLEFIATAPPGDILISGKTERTVYRNILRPIQGIVGPGNFHYARNTGECTIAGRLCYVAGANDERAEEKIRGMTLIGAYVDEATVLPESYFRMLGTRLSLPGAKMFVTTNPDSPFHWLYTDYIQNPDIDAAVFHFTLDDNPALSEEYKAALKAEYSGLWYQRFILGLWVQAEGAVYDMWDESKHVLDEPPGRAEAYYVAIDYGTSNPTVFGLFGVRGKVAWMEREYYYDPGKTGRQKTDAEYSEDLARFLDGIVPRAIIVDPSALSFKVQLRRDGFENVRNADNSVIDGIRTQSSMLHQGRYFVLRCCTRTIEEYGAYVWDAKAQQRGEDKPVKENDHSKDAERYFLHTVFGKGPGISFLR